MNTVERNTLLELNHIITKMPLEVCCYAALPEFGLRWKEVSRAVRNGRMPMQSSSVARVLCAYLSKSTTEEELHNIISRLRLKLVAYGSPKWHVIHLLEPSDDDEFTCVETLRQRLLAALRLRHKGKGIPEVQSLTRDDLVYFSIQFKSELKQSSPLYLAVPPGQPVMLVSHHAADKVLKACAEGLGYLSYMRAELHGSHIPSLLRVACGGAWGSAGPRPPYEHVPVQTSTGIDYTQNGDRYLQKLIGPDPPLLTELTLESTSRFVNPSFLNKTMSITLHLKSDNVATSFQAWAMKGAIAPDSELFQIIHDARSNKIKFTKDNDEEGSE